MFWEITQIVKKDKEMYHLATLELTIDLVHPKQATSIK